MRASISYLLFLPALALAEFPACAKDVQSSTWHVQDLDYHTEQTYTTPAHSNDQANITFILSSSAVTYSAHCTATTAQRDLLGNQWYPCDLAAVGAPPPEGDKAFFQFNAGGYKLELNQTWTCVQGENPTVTRFNAYGFKNAELDCHTSTWKNPDWNQQTGGIYQTIDTDCSAKLIDVPIQQISAVA